MKRLVIAKAFTIAALTALALGIAPAANAADKECSNATLKGTFAHNASGFVTSPPPAVPLASVSTITFDGNGALSETGIISLNGNIVPATGTGTYTVNADCTGTFAVQIPPLGITGHTFFVIDDSGNELQIIETDPGTVATAVARRQFPVGDSERRADQLTQSETQ